MGGVDNTMKQLELSTNELYFLTRQMRKLNIEHENRYAKSIYDKSIALFDDRIYADVMSEEEFAREYECEWGSSKIEGAYPIERMANEEYYKLAEESNKRLAKEVDIDHPPEPTPPKLRTLPEFNYMNTLLKKYGRNI